MWSGWHQIEIWSWTRPPSEGEGADRLISRSRHHDGRLRLIEYEGVHTRYYTTSPCHDLELMVLAQARAQVYVQRRISTTPDDDSISNGVS